MTYLIRFIRFIGIVLLFLAGAVLVDINRAGMTLVEGWYPGYGAWAFAALAALELLCLFCLWRSVFGRKSHLVLRLDADAEEKRRFREALRRRLAVNPHVRKAGIESSDPLFVERALAVLDGIAEEEIRAGGSRVFLGTALAQNGRLDALIVFLSLCRTVWRISSIYNQKPLPAEIWSVYGVVSSATFVAFSIDALDIPQTITDAMSEMVPSVAPSMAASSVPLAGNIAKVFTSAAIHGAANCLLVVRAGVITRRAYRYAVSETGDEDLRSSCVPETAAIVKSISREAVASIATTLKKQFGLLARESGRRFVGGIADAAGAAGQKVSDVVTGVTGAAADTARSAAGVVTDAAHTAAAKAGVAGQRVSDAFADVAKTASNAVTGAGNRAVGMAQEAMGKVAAAGGSISENGRKIVSAMGGSVLSAAHAAAEKTGMAGRKVMESSRNAAGAVRDTAVRAADAVTGTARSAARTVEKAGGRAVDGVRNVTKGAGAALSRTCGALVGGLLRRQRHKDGQ